MKYLYFNTRLHLRLEFIAIYLVIYIKQQEKGIKP